MPKRYLLVLVVITIVFFAGVFLLIRLLTSSNGIKSSDSSTTSTNNSSTINKNSQNTNKFSNDASRVSYTIYGRVVGEEDRRAVRITIDQTQRRVDILSGYEENVLDSKTYSNTTAAYQSFLLAIEPLGFGRYNKDVTVDDRTACPLGTKYVFETLYNDKSTTRSWATSCSSKEGSFVGNKNSIDRLFKAQISDYSKFTGNVTL